MMPPPADTQILAQTREEETFSIIILVCLHSGDTIYRQGVIQLTSLHADTFIL